MIASLERKPLGQLLLNKGLIKPEDLERALEEQKRSNHQKLLGEVLVEMGFCSEDQITESLAQAYGVPYARVSPRIADPKVIASLPKEFLEKHQVLPLFLVEGILTVAIPEPGDHQLRIRYRIDGRLFEKLRPPFQMHAAVISRVKIMAGLDIAERRLPQDGSIHVMMDKRPVDLRVATLPGKYGEKLVIRIIDNDRGSINLERLGFSYETLKQWRKLISLPNGILLVTGPTGSGKSTTLYASLQELNEPDVNICTVEDPIEYAMGGVNQFQVQEKIGFTFANALRALLRQDPD